MKHIEKLKEILESELGDYSYHFDYSIEFDVWENSDENVEYYQVTVQGTEDQKKRLNFAVTSEKVEIELGEDSW